MFRLGAERKLGQQATFDMLLLRVHVMSAGKTERCVVCVTSYLGFLHAQGRHLDFLPVAAVLIRHAQHVCCRFLCSERKVRYSKQQAANYGRCQPPPSTPSFTHAVEVTSSRTRCLRNEAPEPLHDSGDSLAHKCAINFLFSLSNYSFSIFFLNDFFCCWVLCLLGSEFLFLFTILRISFYLHHLNSVLFILKRKNESVFIFL